MDPKMIILSELNQTEKDKYCIYMWNLKYDTDELICETNRLTDLENRLVLAKVVDASRMDWEFGISRCKLLYTCITITLPYTRS